MKPRISDMHPELQVKFLAFCGKMAEAGVPFGLSCVKRTRAEQEALYAQGRENLSDVNAKRALAGMSAIDEKTNSRAVTWTKNSRHFPDPTGKSRAFDIFILRGDKKATWDLKFDGDEDGIPDYLEAAKIGKACGLDCGAFWKGKPDYAHMQLFDKV